MSNCADSLILRSLQKKPIPRTPAWIMRQAGRYLPEYRQVRAKAGDFMSLCKTPDLACEVTLQPLRRFPLDAAILFSDILTIPDAMGLGLSFIESEGPRFARRIEKASDIDALPGASCIESLSYVMDAVRLIRQEMPQELPLIGFSGSPWTLAAYIVEGGSSRDFKSILQMMYSDGENLHRLLAKLAEAVEAYLEQQILAGVNLLMLFDTWGGILTKANYLNFSLHYLRKIAAKLKSRHPTIPLIVFSKNGGQWLKEQAAEHFDALGLDWHTDLGEARAAVGDRLALQGNLDPSVLRSTPKVIREQVQAVLRSYGKGSGHIFNLGHGITPDISPENVAIMLEALQEFSPEYHH